MFLVAEQQHTKPLLWFRSTSPRVNQRRPTLENCGSDRTRPADSVAAKGEKNRIAAHRNSVPYQEATRPVQNKNSPCMTIHTADPLTHAHVASNRHIPTPLRPCTLPISRASTTSPGATRAHGHQGRVGGGGRHSGSRPCHRSRRPESRGHHNRPPWQPPTRWSSGDPRGQNPPGWPARAGRWASWGLHRQGANGVDQDTRQ